MYVKGFDLRVLSLGICFVYLLLKIYQTTNIALD